MDIKEMTDKELMYWYRIAQEMRDGKDLKALKLEMNRRVKEQ